MKKYSWIAALITIMAVMLIGCGKKNEVNTDKLSKSFQSADASTQGSISEAVIDIQSADYAAAMTKLQAVAAKAKLTPEQQQVIKDTIEQLKKLAGDAATKAVGDLQKALPK